LTIGGFPINIKQMYIISIKTGFSASHRIRGYKGNCSRLHGHNYKVEVNVKVDAVNKLGMCIDFRELKSISNKAVNSLDHKNLNDIAFFKENNPTAENIAKFLFGRIRKGLKVRSLLHSVKVWETEEYAVTYSDAT